MAGPTIDTTLRARLADGSLAGRWNLDPSRSSVKLRSRSMWGLAPVKGAFGQVSGEGVVSATGEVSGTIAVASASVDSKIKKRDQHLRSAEFFDSETYPQIEELDGFCSASLMIDRNTGRAVGSVTFDSRETLDRSRDRGEAIRAAGTQDAGVRVLEVAEFELAVAHLRVPEMA